MAQDIVVTSDLPPPLVDYVAPLHWYTLQAGLGNMLKKVTTITIPGSTHLNGSPATYNEVYVNAAGPVQITMPLESLLIQGQEWAIKDISGAALTNPITVAPAGAGVLIDGRGSFNLDANWASMAMTWNGVGYSVKT